MNEVDGHVRIPLRLKLGLRGVDRFGEEQAG